VTAVKRIFLKRAREKKQFTQAQLEAETSRRGRTVRQSHISKLERRVPQRLDFGVVSVLAAALDVDPRSLVFGPDQKEQQVAS